MDSEVREEVACSRRRAQVATVVQVLMEGAAKGTGVVVTGEVELGEGWVEVDASIHVLME